MKNRKRILELLLERNLKRRNETNMDYNEFFINDDLDYLSKTCPLKIGENDSCIGCLCMAWRWSSERSLKGKKRDGYCGLAGEPKFL